MWEFRRKWINIFKISIKEMIPSQEIYTQATY